MKVLHISKSISTGGASVAALRLVQALRKNAVDAVMLAQASGGMDMSWTSHSTPTIFKRILNLYRFVLERMIFLFYEESKRVRFLFSIANTGEALFRKRIIREADIIHLHWVNAGFVSLKGLGRLLDLDKPVVWTLHDMWAFTGGCHYARDCTRYRSECGNCPYLRRKHPDDLSHRVWGKKRKILRHRNFIIITPSNWLKECVKSSSLLGDYDIHVIPNPIDHDLFMPADKKKARLNLGLNPDKQYILFGAANIRNVLKGFDRFRKAMHLLFADVDDKQITEVMLFGKSATEVSDLIPFKTHGFSFVGSVQKMIELYNAAHVMVVPSIQDNLPLTVMESMACGTPAVGFRTGGIPDMIDHKQNGYLAEELSESDLAGGIRWILENEDYETLTLNARQKVLDNFTEASVAEKFRKVYQEIFIEKSDKQ